MTTTAAADERLILDTIDQWVEREVAPVAMEMEHADAYPEHLVEQMKELGLFGAVIP
ncbi:MAG: acyl-CoA dehydrogenase family protein, partial [Gammaproteobacteria bacterium]|nr:acyl-CoA dehydrogenase family protein [Gammaproteobacteria bacterium]